MEELQLSEAERPAPLPWGTPTIRAAHADLRRAVSSDLVIESRFNPHTSDSPALNSTVTWPIGRALTVAAREVVERLQAAPDLPGLGPLEGPRLDACAETPLTAPRTQEWLAQALEALIPGTTLSAVKAWAASRTRGQVLLIGVSNDDCTALQSYFVEDFVVLTAA